MIELRAPSLPAPPTPKGRVITFYSYKGGTGRSMALANVAWQLVLNGFRVLVIDWDLEAPGIHRFFEPFFEDKELLATQGLLDYVENLAAHSATSTEEKADQKVEVIDYILPLEWPRDDKVPLTWKKFGRHARLDLLPAGQQGPAYSRRLAKFSWIDFYERLGGRRLLQKTKEQLQTIYDYILIDSRTGVSDTSGICTVEMPDTLVICFTLNRQSITGASAVAKSVIDIRNSSIEQSSGTETETPPKIRILPVPTRVEITSERDKLRVGLDVARRTFSPYLDSIPASGHARYWGNIQMAYFPFYAFEEIPAVFGDSPNQLLSLSTAVSQLTAVITDNAVTTCPPLADEEHEAERIRREVAGWFLRRSSDGASDVAWLAQELFERIRTNDRQATLNVLARLVQIGEGGVLSAKSAPIEDFGKRAALLTPFVQAKLIAITESASARTVSWSEPTLIEKWKTLRDWIQENRSFLILRQTLVAAISSWKLAEHDESLLLRGKALVEANGWTDARPDDLSDEEHQFISMSTIAETQATEHMMRPKPARPWWRSLVLMESVAVVLVVLSGFGVWYRQRVREAEARASAILDGVRSNANNDPLTAILLLLELNQPSPPGIFQSVAGTLAKKPIPFTIPVKAVTSLQFSADGSRLALASEDGVEIHDTKTWRKLRSLLPGRAVQSASFNQRGNLLAILSDNTIAVTDWSSGQQRLALNTGPSMFVTKEALEARFSPDEHAIVVRDSGGNIGRFSSANGHLLDFYFDQTRNSAVFTPDGSYAIVANQPGEIRQFETSTGTARQISKGYFSSNGFDRGILAVDCRSQWAVIDLRNEKGSILVDLAHVSPKTISQYRPAAFDCSGKLAVAEGIFTEDGSRVLARFPSSPSDVLALTFNPTGTALAMGSKDMVRIWMLDRQPPPQGADWTELISYFRKSTNACLSAADRKKYLNEVTVVAEQKAADCEAKLGQ